MFLTESNYHSPEANKEYLSVSQYKDFCGTLGRAGCEARALAKVNGEWEDPTSLPMLIGSYVDSHFEGTLDLFKMQHPEICKKRTPELKAAYQKAEEVIQRIERDDFFMLYMSGKKQIILTAEMFGAKWKIKMDSYHPGKCIVDLKVIKNLHEKFWVKDLGHHVSFILYWGYDLQLAIYQAVEEIISKNKIVTYIAGADKTNQPDIAIIELEQYRLDEAIKDVEKNTPRILQLKAGEVEPIRCETCDYCKHTKVLTEPISSEKLIEGF